MCLGLLSCKRSYVNLKKKNIYLSPCSLKYVSCVCSVEEACNSDCNYEYAVLQKKPGGDKECGQHTSHLISHITLHCDHHKVSNSSFWVCLLAQWNFPSSSSMETHHCSSSIPLTLSSLYMCLVSFICFFSILGREFTLLPLSEKEEDEVVKVSGTYKVHSWDGVPKAPGSSA